MKDFVILNLNFEDFNVLLFLRNEVTQKKKKNYVDPNCVRRAKISSLL